MSNQDKYLDKDFLKKIKPKLIRDNIPDLIISQGKYCTISQLSGDELYKFQKQKVLEELDEFKEAVSDEDKNATLEELADLLEIYSYWRFGSSLNQYILDTIMGAVLNKRNTNGAFDKNLCLRAAGFLEDN